MKMKTDIISRTLAAAAIAVTAASAFTLASCGSDDDPDQPHGGYGTSPYTIQMRVLSPDGQNLLDLKNASTVARDSIVALYEGQAYRLDTTYTPSRADITLPLGLRLYAPTGTRNFVMFFGEFKGDENVEGKDIVINWNDGSDCDTVTFSHSYTTTGGTPQTATTVQLNHKPATLPITFVKER